MKVGAKLRRLILGLIRPRTATGNGESNLVMGVRSYGHVEIIAWQTESSGPPYVSVGNYCSIAHQVRALINGDHNPSWATTFPFLDELGDEELRRRGHPRATGPIKIGNDVWIGAHVLLLGGVEIGDGAVVAAGSVVTRSVRPYALVAGNPAREIRRRFSDIEIERLLAMRWWDLEPAAVSGLADILSRPLDIESLERAVHSARKT